MQIELNGEKKEIGSESTLLELIKHYRISSQSIAVAVNQEIIPRSQLASVQIREGDQIEVIQPVGGG